MLLPQTLRLLLLQLQRLVNMSNTHTHLKTLSYARHIGRELAFLTLSSLVYQHQDQIEHIHLEELLERAVRVLLAEAEECLQRAGQNLQEVYHRLAAMELNGTIKTPVKDMDRIFRKKSEAMEDFRKALMEQALEMEHACHLMADAMQIPLLRILADMPHIREFALELVSQYHLHQDQVDREIDCVSTEWPLERMHSIDRDLIRLAATEMFYDPFSRRGDSTPLPVVINEAIELAKKYGTEDSYRFVNGVLRNLLPKAEELRRGELV